MVDPDREPLEGVVEVDQAEIAFREGDTFFEPGNAGKILVIGLSNHRARHESSQTATQARQISRHAFRPHSPRDDFRQFLRSIEAFVNANVKRGATLLTDGHKSYPGLTGYRPDPRVVGKMAAHMFAVDSSAFSLMRRWSLGHITAFAQAVDTYLNEFVFRYNRRYYRHVSFETLLGSRRQRARELLGHHQARQSTQKREPGGIGAPTTYRRA